MKMMKMQNHPAMNERDAAEMVEQNHFNFVDLAFEKYIWNSLGIHNF